VHSTGVRRIRRRRAGSATRRQQTAAGGRLDLRRTDVGNHRRPTVHPISALTVQTQQQRVTGDTVMGNGNKVTVLLLLSCAKSHMLSASRRQPHLLHVSAVDRRQIWSMDKS